MPAYGLHYGECVRYYPSKYEATKALFSDEVLKDLGLTIDDIGSLYSRLKGDDKELVQINLTKGDGVVDAYIAYHPEIECVSDAECNGGE